jgi:hypothetical protein
MDLISRQAAIDALVKRTHLTWEYLKIIYPMLNVLEELPSAERHGRWEDVEHAPHNLFYATCSVCGDRQTIEVANYCPMCGSRMDEVSKR